MTEPDGDIMMPRRAMVLAAGLGLRMRPITLTRPKPLVMLAGRTLLDRALDALEAAGVTTCMVNTHYLGHMIADHLRARARPRILLSPESRLLDTGGGVAKARKLLGRDPFFVVNADIAWDEGVDGQDIPGETAAPALARLATAFDPSRMDALLLLAPRMRAVGYDGVGDFQRDAIGRLTRRGGQGHAPFVFTGVQILNPSILAGAPGGVFSLNLLYDRAIASKRLFGLEHLGRWFHVGTPDGLRLAEDALKGPVG